MDRRSGGQPQSDDSEALGHIGALLQRALVAQIDYHFLDASSQLNRFMDQIGSAFELLVNSFDADCPEVRRLLLRPTPLSPQFLFGSVPMGQ